MKNSSLLFAGFLCAGLAVFSSSLKALAPTNKTFPSDVLADAFLQINGTVSPFIGVEGGTVAAKNFFVNTTPGNVVSVKAPYKFQVSGSSGSAFDITLYDGVPIPPNTFDDIPFTFKSTDVPISLNTVTTNVKPVISASDGNLLMQLYFKDGSGTANKFSFTPGTRSLAGFKPVVDGAIETNSSRHYINIPMPSDFTGAGIYDFNLKLRNSTTGDSSQVYKITLYRRGIENLNRPPQSINVIVNTESTYIPVTFNAKGLKSDTLTIKPSPETLVTTYVSKSSDSPAQLGAVYYPAINGETGLITVYVKLKAGAQVGTNAGKIELYDGFSQELLSLVGLNATVVSTSNIFDLPADGVAGFSTVQGIASGSAKIQIDSKGIPQTFTLKAPTDFEVAADLGANSAFSELVTATTNTFLVRIKANAQTGPVGGNVNISNNYGVTKMYYVGGNVRPPVVINAFVDTAGVKTQVQTSWKFNVLPDESMAYNYTVTAGPRVMPGFTTQSGTLQQTLNGNGNPINGSFTGIINVPAGSLGVYDFNIRLRNVATGDSSRLYRFVGHSRGLENVTALAYITYTPGDTESGPLVPFTFTAKGLTNNFIVVVPSYSENAHAGLYRSSTGTPSTFLFVDGANNQVGPTTIYLSALGRQRGESPGSLLLYDGVEKPANLMAEVPFTFKSIAPVASHHLTFSNTTATSTNVSWTNGNGKKRAVFVKQVSSGVAAARDSVIYTAGNFGAGTQIGTTGWYCVYNGTGNSTAINGLSPSATYRVTVIDYSGTPGYEFYIAGGLAPANVTTLVDPAAAPVTPASRISFANTTPNSTTVNWTNGNGTARAVFIANTNNGVSAPVANTTYTANTAFAAGTQVGTSGWYCIYNGTGSSVNVTGLTGNQTYRVTVVEYNGNAGAQKYISTGLAPASIVTPADPAAAPTQASYRLTFTNVTSTTATVSWTNGNGANRAVFVAQTNFGVAAPANNTTYTPNTAFASGNQIASTGWYCVYTGNGSSVNLTGLTSGATYRVTVVDYNGTAGSQKYLATGLAPANVATVGIVAPSQASYRLAFTNTTATSTTLSWTNGTGAARAVFVKQTNNGYAQAVNNTTYSANSSFGAGTQIGTTGWYCIYVGTGNSTTISGLNATTLYRFTVVDYNGSAGSQQYIATGLAPAMVFTGSNGGGGNFRTNGIATASNLGDSTSPAIEAANILSPNGDGKNDTWIVKNIEAYPNSTVAVYTKDGRQIFQEKGYYNEWNGGGSLTKGTYYYTIDLGNGEVQKGYITVL